MDENEEAEPQTADDSSPAAEDSSPAEASTPPSPTDPALPDYKGAPIDPDRGPGLGCFWFQVFLLVALLIITPISVVLSAPSWLSAALLILSLVLLFFVGQTMIFLLRLVAADRRTRRRPMGADARKTVGQIEDDASPVAAVGEADAAPAIGSNEDSASDEPLT